MSGMKWLLALALAVACTSLEAQSSAPLKAVDKFTASQTEKSAKLAEPQRRRAASVAVALTDDADSILLPPFATRTSPLPMRFLRVGLEWSF